MRGSKVRTQDVWVPRRGVAIHINAFNFPAWGMVGKLAVALLAGMPVLSKPATSTSALAGRIAELIIDSQVLPKGAFSLLMGPAGDLLDHVGPQDVIAFTGSADTGRRIRAHEAVLRAGTRVNLEADSLNAAIVGIDVEPGTDLFDVLVRDLVVEMTQKAGQKCTATRRVLVPEPLLARLRERLIDRLGEIAAKTGNPVDEGVRMGPLATRAQLHDAHRGIEALANGAARIFGDPSRTQFVGVEAGKGFFLEPLVFEATSEAASDRTAVFHHREVFGPVTTLLPYDGELATASRIVAHGQGNLVGTFYSDDRKLMRRAVAEIGSHVGRMVLVHEKIAGASMCPGGVFPVVHHGGPGRAGDGAELDGTFGLGLYMQRTTLQGGGGQLARILGG
jgi:oxepin-CoA hydrolase/3-oxo-5,6-dehydrosuberyl-CoA semialdehyde dehydrogenase